MKKSLVLALVFSFGALGSSTIAQPTRWEPLGDGLPNIVWELFADTTDGILYAGGAFGNNFPSTPIRGIAKWDGVKWDSLGAGSYDPVYAITKYQGDIYMGGAFEKIDGMLVNSIARWDGTEWDSLGYGATCCSDTVGPGGAVNSLVSDLLVYNNELYVGGGFKYAGGKTPARGIAKWDGVNWSDVGTFPISDPSITTMAEYNGDLYVAGNFGTGTSFRYIAKWDGTHWDSVGTGFYGGLAYIMTMAVYKGELYVGGTFSQTEDSRNPGNYIAKWDGTEWSDVGGSVMGFDSFSNGQVWDMDVVNGELWVAGVFSFAGGVPAQTIAKWDGTEWCGIGSEFSWNPYAIEALNNEMYIGGGFFLIDGDTLDGVAKWVGGNYVDTCGVIVNSSEELIYPVDELIVYPNPSNGIFTVELNLPEADKMDLIVYDLQGKKLIIKEQKINGKHIMKLDLSRYRPGVYFVQMSTTKEVLNTKIVLTQ